MKKEKEEEKPVTEDTDEEAEMLRDYFQLNVSLGDLYLQWGAADPHFQRIAASFPGQFASAQYDTATDEIDNI